MVSVEIFLKAHVVIDLVACEKIDIRTKQTSVGTFQNISTSKCLNLTIIVVHGTLNLGQHVTNFSVTM